MTRIDHRLKAISPRWAKDAANSATRRYGVVTAGHRPLPDFLLVGTKRGGTTSLWNWLTSHPAVLPMFPGGRGLKSTDWFFGDDRHDETWYRSHFHTRAYRSLVARRLGQQPVCGEASPYYMYDPRIPVRIRAAVPDVKIIVVLRHPVKRAFSHWQERVGQGVEPLSFADALLAEETRTAGELDRMLADPTYHSRAHDWYSYRDRGVYLPQIHRLIDLFPTDRLLVLSSEDMYRDQQSAFDLVCDFLGVKRLTMPTFERHNTSPSLPMEESVRRELATFYAPHNAALAELLGRDYGWDG